MKKLLKYILYKFKFPSARISYSAQVSLNSVLGQGVKVLENCILGSCHIASYTYIGINGRFEKTNVGSFTSVGPDVICGLASHPMNYVTTYPGFYTKNASGAVWFGSEKDFVDQKNVEIGSDVWIGARCIILGGVKIGHGAVLGAGSIITKDIPPYAIVAGVPAKILKYRFEEPLIVKLLNSEWWSEPKGVLEKVSKYASEPDMFLEKLNALKLQR
jgi:acetyltransferase-like isoleucine patch superfamily enzyme